MRHFTTVLAVGLVALTTLNCDDDSEKYKAIPAYSGAKPSLPPVPPLPTNPIRVGDSYSVFGAIHQLNSKYHSTEVTAKDISITGYIVDSNITTAPKCAVHKTGKKDPDDCKSEIPTFAIADAKGDMTGPRIRVMGWASNFANVFDAMQAYKDLKDPPKPPPTPDQAGKPGFLVNDELWAVSIPYPLPAVGAKVKVTGRYGIIFSKASSGLKSDPQNGIITYTALETMEPPTEPAAFPKK
jgi:hypothetical protein